MGIRLDNAQKKYFHTWYGHMKQRCTNPSCKDYKHYGGRGIDYDRNWKTWKDAMVDIVSTIGLRPTAKHSIDRMNNDDGYYIGNLRWATAQQQADNKRKPSKHKKPLPYTRKDSRTIGHETKTLNNWLKDSRAAVKCRSTVRNRMKRGMTFEQALTTAA